MYLRWYFDSCVRRAMSSHSSHLPQEVLLAQFSLYYPQIWPKTQFIPFHFYLRWSRVATSHGKTLLSLAFNYGVMSLKTLSLGVVTQSIVMQDSPHGCFLLLQEDDKIRMLLQVSRYFTAFTYITANLWNV